MMTELKDEVLRLKLLTPIYQQRISKELQKAYEQIGSLGVEQGYWILMPSDPQEEACRIEAVGGKKRHLVKV